MESKDRMETYWKTKERKTKKVLQKVENGRTKMNGENGFFYHPKRAERSNTNTA